MKNKLTQLYFFLHNIDKRYIQLAYFAFLLAGFFAQAPIDGGTGPRTGF